MGSTFVLNPLMVLTDTFAEITEGSPAFAIGKLCLEVVGLYSFVLGILALAPSPAPICTVITRCLEAPCTSRTRSCTLLVARYSLLVSWSLHNVCLATRG